MILYINGEHCTSLEQLKSYFSMNLTPESDIYADLLDYGRHGDIAAWLRERGEQKLSTNVESIASSLSDSSFYTQLKAVITGETIPEHTNLKPTFDKCISFEDMKCDVKDTEAKVRVILKVLLCVNEEYELRVSCDWGTRAMMVNPYNYSEGKSASFEFTFHKRPGKDIGEITVLGEDKVLSSEKSLNNNTSIDEFTIGGVPFKMVRVEGGTFQMGATTEQYDPFGDEKPVHSVTMSGYYIGQAEVTQALWKAVMGTNPSNWRGDNLPVECVSWNDCQEFIRKLNKLTGQRFRLPTEAEWEYAARGGKQSRGYHYAGSDNIDYVAWYCNNSDSRTHPVATKQPNELGIYDMSGNVWEWCQDWYGNYGSDAQTNPTGPGSGSRRVIRGGGWIYGACICRLSCRSRCAPDITRDGIGLRLAI